MKTQITKKQAINLFGSAKALYEALGISKQAVSQWPDDKPIPEDKALRIRYELKPEAFDGDNKAA